MVPVSAPTAPPRAGLFLLYPLARLPIFSMVPDQPSPPKARLMGDMQTHTGTKLKALPVISLLDGAFFCLIQTS